MDVFCVFSTSTGNWKYIATDGSDYDSLALLHAAGKTPFPGLDQNGPYPQGQGMYPAQVTLRNRGSGAFQYRINADTLPTDGPTVEAADPPLVIDGVNPVSIQPISSVCIKKATAGDSVELYAEYDN